MSQTDRISNHLMRYGSITPLEALRRYSCMRLAARVAELRERGLGIETEMIRRNGKRLARYRYHSGAH